MDVPVPLQLRALLNMFSRFSCVVLVISSLIATFSNWNDEFQCRASVKQCRTKNIATNKLCYCWCYSWRVLRSAAAKSITEKGLNKMWKDKRWERGR